MTRRHSRRAALLSWPLLALTATLVSSQAWAASGSLAGLAAGDEVIIILDRRQNPRDVLQRLAQAGFTTTEVITGLPPRYANYRKMKSANNADTRAKLLAVDGVAAVQPLYRSQELNYPILTTGQVIVRFKPGTTVAQVNDLAAQNNCMVTRDFPGLPQAYVLDPLQGDADPSTIAQNLLASGHALYSHPSIMFRLQKHQSAATVIDDPLYVFQWHLRNTGQLPGGVPGADIKVEEAWQTTLGEGAVVAVVDDSVQRDHEDLDANYVTGFDFLGSTICTPESTDCTFNFPSFGFGPVLIAGNDGDPSPFFGPDPFSASGFFFIGDPVGEAHGTNTAGVICAEANNLGGRGVAPNASLIGIKIGLEAFYTTDQDVADAYLFAERNGAMVVNSSWGGPGQAILPTIPNTSLLLPDLISDAITEIATNGRGGRGVLPVFSAGNGDQFSGAPLPVNFGNVYAAIPQAMAVGAVMRDDRVSCYSNFGQELSVMAPGGGVSATATLGSLGSLLLNCFDSDITTTDVMETPCFLANDFVPFDLVNGVFGDGQLDAGFPCRGVNPPLRFLNVFFVTDPTTFFDQNPALSVPLGANTFVQDFPQVNYTHHFNGTSAAAPVVSGVAALVFSVNQNLTAQQVKNLIEHTADKPGYINETFDGVTGFNQRYGHGRVNAARAVAAAVAGNNWPSPVLNVQEVHSQSLVRLLWTNPIDDAAGILIVRGTGGTLDWAPVDGIIYQVGQQVAANAFVVSNDLIESLDQTGLPSGDFQYALFVRNAQNFYSWGRRTGFTADNPVDRPVAAISASPQTGPVPLKVHFAGGGVDKTGIIGFSWNFGDGSTASGPTIDHTYTAGGTFTATLTVTNAVNQTAQTSVVIKPQAQPNVLPVASMAATPTTGSAPLVVVFRASATDADGFITSYSWDFGDGSTATGQTVEHIYLVPGTYGAVLSAIDNTGGIGSASQIILVSGSAPTAGATDPPGILNQPPTLCGLGTAGAFSMSLLGLFLMAVRRRF